MYPYNIGETKYTKNPSVITAASTPSKAALPIPDDKLLTLIKEAIVDENKDAFFYKELMNRQKSKTDQEILRSLYLDEMKHKKYFQEIYQILTGEKLPEPEETSKSPESNLISAYEKSFFGELEAVEFYRQILFSILNQEIRDMLYEIITDEQKHAAKLQYLLWKTKSN